jgi:hypothetical protein
MLRQLGMLLAVLLPCLSGCGSGDWNALPPSPDMNSFASDVYPLLLRDCAFNNTCHGSPDRFFQVVGPGRRRLDPMLDSMEPPTADEIQLSYDRARAMLMAGANVDRSLLLIKPLEEAAGGTGHRGVDHFGRNVYQTTQDPAYVTLQQWAHGSGGAAPQPPHQ